MKIFILISLLFSFSFGLSLAPAGNSNPPPQEDPSIKTAASDSNISNFVESEKNRIKQEVENTRNTLQKRVMESYFISVKTVGNQYGMSSIICPPLKNKWIADLHYYTRIDHVDIEGGKITCSAIDEKNKEQFSKIFKINNFEEYFDNLKIPNSQHLIFPRATETHRLFEKNQMMQAANHTETDPKQLNFVQLLVAVLSSNTEILNIPATIESSELTFNNGYYYIDQEEANAPVSAALDTLRRAAAEVLDDNGLEQFNIFNKPGATIEQSQNNNSIFIFLLEIVSIISPIFADLLFWIVFAVVMINITNNYMIKENTMQQQSTKQIVIHLIAGLSLLAYFRATPIDIKTQNDFGQTVKIEVSRLQQDLGAGFMYVTDIGDEMTENIIKLYIKYLNSANNIDSTKIIKRVETERYKSIKELELRNDIEKKCSETYNMFELKNVKNKLGKAYSDYNLYPATQKLAATEFGKDPYAKLLNNAPSSNLLSLPMCFNNRNNIRALKQKIDRFRQKIDNYNNPAMLELNIAKLNAVNSNMWSLYDQFGYMSIPYLAVLQGINQIFRNIQKKTDEYQHLIFDSQNRLKDYSQFAMKNLMLATFVDTSSVSGIIDKITALSPSSWIPFGIGDLLHKGLSLSILLILIDFLSSIGEALKVGLFMILSIVTLFFGFVMMFLAYLTVPFAVLKAFGSNQFNDIYKILGNFVFAATRPLFQILAIVFALIFSELYSIVYHIFIAKFDLLLAAFNSFVVSGFAAVLDAVFVLMYYLTQFYLIYSIITKTPGWLMNLLNINVNDMVEQVSDQLSHKMQGMDDEIHKKI